MYQSVSKRIKVKECCVLQPRVCGVQHPVTFIVVSDAPSLLGCDTSERLDLVRRVYNVDMKGCVTCTYWNQWQRENRPSCKRGLELDTVYRTVPIISSTRQKKTVEIMRNRYNRRNTINRENCFKQLKQETHDAHANKDTTIDMEP